MAIQVAFNELDSWLQAQPENTKTTPYELEITGEIDTDWQGSQGIGNILKQNSNKYVDLSATTLSEEIVVLERTFQNCSTLVGAPVIPNSVEYLDYCFEGCTNLKKIPRLPDSCLTLMCAFNGCTSLVTVPKLPYTDFFDDCFYGCTSLETVYFPSITEEYCYDHNRCFNGCTNLVNFHSDTPYELKNWLNTIYEETEDDEHINFPNDPATCNYYLSSETAEIPLNKLNNELQTLKENNALTPYKIKISELIRFDIDSHRLDNVLFDNLTKYIDLSETIIPNSSNVVNAFNSCSNIVVSPIIPNDCESMYSCFYGCSSLKVVTNIPNKITNMYNCFRGCSSLESVPTIPSSVTNMEGCFRDCLALVTTPNIPNGVTNISECFQGCESLITAPIIPNSVIKMSYCFENCRNLKIVPNVPHGITYMDYSFSGCSSLEEITQFDADLESLVSQNNAMWAFYFCLRLSKIGVSTPLEESDWHVFSLKFGADNVSGKVYDKHGTASTIQQTQITKSDLILPVYTDELWFPSGYTDAQLETIIQKMITYKYGVFNKETIPPDEKTFVLQADNPAHFRSNLPFVKESDVVDTVASGNLHSVTSNAVAGALANKKNVQDAVNDPTSDGQQYWDFIRSITQDTNGKIYPVKSHLPYGWTTQAGIVTTYDNVAYDEDRSHVVNRLGLYNALYSGYYFDISSTVTEKVAVLNSLYVGGCVKNNFVKLHISIVNLANACTGYDVITVCKLPDNLSPAYDTARGICFKQGSEGSWIAEVLTNGYVRVWSWGTSGFAVYDNLEIIIDYPLK